MRIATVDVETEQKSHFVDVTKKVKAMVKSAGVEHGVVYLFCPHTTAGITLQENTDEDLHHDVLLALDAAASAAASGYRHAEGNSHAHLKASLFGFSLTLLVEKGRLVLGAWQSIYLCEFDGPRTRQLHIKVVPG